ncbi:hypothetical protein BU23DRAFT_18358 [Bimuria novae-zelandiae CBS 107.79]|uniref:Uncharacterized protein n=1 Tax=Bimuria novae-zelandiae CBS 107.79 TaxID=1447943 RepID=A0A6A5UPI2_9PLEO|nr:hypothetical protein BU23DRAFT_18358 [Bimuria novae-zelandiae CBS 107.79]
MAASPNSVENVSLSYKFILMMQLVLALCRKSFICAHLDLFQHMQPSGKNLTRPSSFGWQAFCLNYASLRQQPTMGGITVLPQTRQVRYLRAGRLLFCFWCRLKHRELETLEGFRSRRVGSRPHVHIAHRITFCPSELPHVNR